MAYTETLTQGLALVDTINFSTTNSTNFNSGGFDFSHFKRAIYLIQNGGLGAAGTVDGRLQSSPNANFNVVHNIAGTNLTQIVTNLAAATIEIRSDQITNANAGDRYLRLQLTSGGNTLTGVWATGFGGEAIQKPGSQYGLNTMFLGQTVVCNI